MWLRDVFIVMMMMQLTLRYLCVMNVQVIGVFLGGAICNLPMFNRTYSNGLYL